MPQGLRYFKPEEGGSVGRCYTGAFFSPLESLVPGPVFCSVVTLVFVCGDEAIPFRRLL